MIVLTDAETDQVRATTTEGHALDPIPLADGDTWVLPEAVLSDPAHADLHDFLAGLPTREASRPNTRLRLKRDFGRIAAYLHRMIDGKRVLALIPARAGSKRLPGKNTLRLAGKPLIAWTVEAATGSRYIDRIAVTTDDSHAAFCAMNAGAHVHINRPKALAEDTSPVVEAVFHALEQLGDWDYVVLLQPTSPLRTSEDIDEAIELCRNAPAVYAVTKPAKPPEFYLNAETMEQAAPHVLLCGAVYVARPEILRETRLFKCPGALPFHMPPERSIDIDEGAEFNACAAILARPESVTAGVFGPYGGPAQEAPVAVAANG